MFRRSTPSRATRLCVAALALASAQWSHAGPVLDQQHTPRRAEIYAATGIAEFAQTFTAGLDGTLARIEAAVEASTGNASEPLLVTLYEVVDRTPLTLETGDQLLQTEVPRSLVPAEWTEGISVDVRSLGVRVESGREYALTFRTRVLSESPSHWLAGSVEPVVRGDPYTRGALYRRGAPIFPNPVDWTPILDTAGQLSENFDAGFATFVLPARVPGPSPMALLALAACALGLRGVSRGTCQQRRPGGPGEQRRRASRERRA